MSIVSCKHWLFHFTPHHVSTLTNADAIFVDSTCQNVPELRGSKDDWQVVGQKHDGLVLKYVIKSTYFELNQYPFEQTFNNEPLFDALNDLPKENSDLVSTLSQVEQLEDPGIASLLKQTVKQELALSPNSEQTIPPSDIVSLIHDPIQSDTSSNPPKKRFKEC